MNRDPDVRSGPPRRALLRYAIAGGALAAVSGCDVIGGRSDIAPAAGQGNTAERRKKAPGERGEFAKKPTWSQDFRHMPKGSTLNPRWWNVETGSLIPSYNNEAEYLTGRRQNVRIEDGRLILEAHKNDDGHSYTSGRVDTGGKFTFTSGKIEVDMQLPSGEGTWPAAWVYANSTPYSLQQLGLRPTAANRNAMADEDGGEADFGEENGNQPNLLVPAIHTVASTLHPTHDAQGKIVPGMYTGLHTYGLELTNDSIGFSLDGELYHSVDRTKQDDNPRSWPFGPEDELMLILDLAMGGTEGGNIQGNGPWEMQVAAARYYPVLTA